jgi:hypothetical protein
MAIDFTSAVSFSAKVPNRRHTLKAGLCILVLRELMRLARLLLVAPACIIMRCYIDVHAGGARHWVPRENLGEYVPTSHNTQAMMFF